MHRLTKITFTMVFGCLMLPVVCFGNEMTLQGAINVALKNSAESRLAKINTSIAELGIDKENANFYPRLDFQLDSEYAKNLSGSTKTTSVGQTVISADDGYRSSGNLSLTYDVTGLFSAGKKAEISSNELTIAHLNEKKTDLQLKGNVTDTFRKAYVNYLKLKQHAQALENYQKLFEMQDRLQKHGQLDYIKIIETRMAIAKIEQNISRSRNEEVLALDQLSYLTGDEYDSETLELLEPETPGRPSNGSMTNTDVIQYQIDHYSMINKSRELDIIDLQKYPRLQVFARYGMYDEDSSFFSSIGNLESRSYSYGIVLSFNIFDGFRYKPTVEALSYEKEKIRTQRDMNYKKVNQYYGELLKTYDFASDELKLKERMLVEAKNQLEIVERLNVNGISSATDVLTERINILRYVSDIKIGIAETKFDLIQLSILLGNY